MEYSFWLHRIVRFFSYCIGFGVAFFAFVGFMDCSNSRTPNGYRRYTILVAAIDIPEGTKINQASLAIVEIDERAHLHSMMHDFEASVYDGYTTKVEFPKGTPLFKDYLKLK
jgi:hypothetical protein